MGVTQHGGRPGPNPDGFGATVRALEIGAEVFVSYREEDSARAPAFRGTVANRSYTEDPEHTTAARLYKVGIETRDGALLMVGAYEFDSGQTLMAPGVTLSPADGDGGPESAQVGAWLDVDDDLSQEGWV